MISAFFTGFSISFGLILAIGSQNAFVLRQGLKNEYVPQIVAFCALSDALLIFLGVYGAGAIIDAFPTLRTIFIWAGILFMMVYGLLRFYSAWKGVDEKNTTNANTNSLGAALAICAAFTYLNPHVYLDTWVLMGALSLPFQGATKLSFAIGASLASLVFFTLLGFGARLLRPLFQNSKAWRILDISIGILMFILAFGLFQTLGSEPQ